MQFGETSMWSKDVQRLLWAAGEARERGRRRDRKRPVARPHDTRPPGQVAGAGFFTEWQPATADPPID